MDWSTQLGKPAAALMQAVAAPFSPGKVRLALSHRLRVGTRVEVVSWIIRVQDQCITRDDTTALFSHGKVHLIYSSRSCLRLGLPSLCSSRTIAPSRMPVQHRARGGH